MNLPASMVYQKKDSYDEKANKVLGIIALEGPKTIYDIYKQTRMPLSTTQRIVRNLLHEQEIVEIGREKHISGTEKKYYGITGTGIAQLFRFNFEPVTENFEKVLEVWWQENTPIDKTVLQNQDVIEAMRHLFTILGSMIELSQSFDQIGVSAEVERVANEKTGRVIRGLEASTLLAAIVSFMLPREEANFKMLRTLYHLSPEIAASIDSYFNQLTEYYDKIRAS